MNKWQKYVFLIPFLFLMAAAWAIRVAYHRGETAGAEHEKSKVSQARLDSNRVRQKQLDSLQRAADLRVAAADSVAAAAVQRARIAKLRADSARARIVIVDSGAVSIDNKPPEPANPILITALERSDERHRMDSIAQASLQKQNDALRSQNRVQGMTIANLNARDSLHMDLESQLREAVRTTGKEKFWKGVKWGAGATLGLLAAVAAIVH